MKKITLTLLLAVVFISACSNTPVEPTVTPTPTPEPIAGIGVYRQDIITYYERELSVQFEPEIIEEGQPIVYGGLPYEDGTFIVVVIAGEEDHVNKATVTFLQPGALISDPDYAAQAHDRIVASLFPLLDAAYPDWDERLVWLDETFRSFDNITQTYTTSERVQGDNTIGMGLEIFIEGDYQGYIGVSLFIYENE